MKKVSPGERESSFARRRLPKGTHRIFAFVQRRKSKIENGKDREKLIASGEGKKANKGYLRQRSARKEKNLLNQSTKILFQERAVT